MKKIWIAVLLAAMVSAFALAGCAGGGGGGSAATTTKDTGVFKVEVAADWTAYDVSDVFAEEENAFDADALQICKSATSETDLFSHPYIDIRHYAPTTYMYTDVKSFYEDVVDVEPIKLGNYEWTGFTGTSSDWTWTILFTNNEGGDNFQVSITPGTTEGLTASLDDPDVQAMIASITMD